MLQMHQTLDQSLDEQIHRLIHDGLDEADFVERLGRLMADSCHAKQHWLLLIDGQATEVLSDDDCDLTSYHELSSRHADFYLQRDTALDEKQPKFLRLEATDDPAIDSSLRPAGFLFFVPIRCQIDADILLCIYRETFASLDVFSYLRQLALFSMLGDRRSELIRARATRDAALSAHETAQEKQEEALRGKNEALAIKHQMKQALDLSSAVSSDLEKEKVGFLLANQLKGYLNVDRVTVIEQVGRQSRLLAVSGQTSINKRANIVRCTQQLANAVVKSGQAFWFDGDQDTLPTQLQSAVSRYLDESLVQSFALIPIFERQPLDHRSEEQSLIEVVNPGRTANKKLRGVILLESIETPLEREIVEPRWEQVAPQIAGQFNNAKRYSDLLFLPLMLALTRFAGYYRGHTRRIAWGITLGIAILLLAGFLVKTDLRVRCEGHLQPEKMHHIFVRKEGIVQEILIKEGQSVTAGHPLVRLQNNELELELASLTGELNEKRRELRDMEYRRLDYQNNTSAQDSDSDYQQLARQSGLLATQIAGLEKNLSLKTKQKEDLVIRAPFDGQVMGWNVDRKFLNRPMDNGTRLFSLAQPEGERILELKVPDQRSGYIATALHENGSQDSSIPVEFSIASLPNQRFQATVTHINPGLEQDSDLGYVLPVEASPDDELPTDLRVGVPVVAKVNCGKRSFIYCKTYEFLDWMHHKSFEYLY